MKLISPQVDEQQAQPEGMRLRTERVVPVRDVSQTGKSSQQVPFSSHVVNDFGNNESMISLETLTEALRASRGHNEPDSTKGKLPEWNIRPKASLRMSRQSPVVRSI